MNLDDLTKLLGAVATILGIGLGAWRISVNSRRSRDLQPIRTYRQMVRDLQAELARVRTDRAQDQLDNEKRFKALEQTQQGQSVELTELRNRDHENQRRILHLRRRVKYLTGLLTLHAPGVEIDPDPEVDGA